MTIQLISFRNIVTNNDETYPISAIDTAQCGTVIPRDTTFTVQLNETNGVVNHYQIYVDGILLQSVSTNGSGNAIEAILEVSEFITRQN